jgi:hypothetical protein
MRLMASRLRRRLVDGAIDAYVEWQEECLSLEDAYLRWSQGSANDRRLAFAAYTEALDREQLASRIYAARCRALNSAV